MDILPSSILASLPNIGEAGLKIGGASYRQSPSTIWRNLTTVEADITEEDIETEDIETEDIETEDALQSSPGPWVLIITMGGWQAGAGCPNCTISRGKDCH